MQTVNNTHTLEGNIATLLVTASAAILQNITLVDLDRFLKQRWRNKRKTHHKEEQMDHESKYLDFLTTYD